MSSIVEESQNDLIRIYVKKRSGNHLAVLNVKKDATVSDLKLQFYTDQTVFSILRIEHRRFCPSSNNRKTN